MFRCCTSRRPRNPARHSESTTTYPDKSKGGWLMRRTPVGAFMPTLCNILPTYSNLPANPSPPVVLTDILLYRSQGLGRHHAQCHRAPLAVQRCLDKNPPALASPLALDRRRN